MKRVIVLLVLFFCSSCYYRHADDVVITSNYFIYNNTERKIEVYKGGKFYYTAENLVRIFTTGPSDNYDEVSIERLMADCPENFLDISIYDVTDGERVFLKTWTFADRDQEGRQLYDLSDCTLEVRDIRDTPVTLLYFDYVFTIYPEDLGL